MVCCMLTRGFQPQVPLNAPRRNVGCLVQGAKVRVRHRHLQHRKTLAARCWVVVVCHMVFDTCIAGVTATASSKTASTSSGTNAQSGGQEGSGTQPPATQAPAASPIPSGEVLGVLWYVTWCLTRALQVSPLLPALKQRPQVPGRMLNQGVKKVQGHSHLRHRHLQHRPSRAVRCWGFCGMLHGV